MGNNKGKKKSPTRAPVTTRIIEKYIRETKMEFFRQERDDDKIWLLLVGLPGMKPRGAKALIFLNTAEKPYILFVLTEFIDVLSKSELNQAREYLLDRNEEILIGKYSLAESYEVRLNHAVPLDNSILSGEQFHRCLRTLILEANRCRTDKENGWTFKKRKS